MDYLYPPDMKNVEAEMKSHLEKNQDLTQLFEVYKKVLAVHLKYLDRIEATVDLEKEEIKELFRQGKFYLKDNPPVIQGELFRGIMDEIAAAIKEASPGAPEPLLQLSQAEEFQAGNLDGFINKAYLLSKQEMEKYVEKIQLDKKAGLDSEVIAFALHMTLSPFLSRYMQEVREVEGFTLWRQHSYCPVCGQQANMARHRSDDGARVLECWLCHAQWVFPRVECPYCDNVDHQKLRYFYVTGDKTRQVHVCEVCKKYLKTVDGKAMEKDVTLDVEAIATGYLDALALREGYRPPEETGTLN